MIQPAGTKLFLWPYVWGLSMAAYKVSLPVVDYARLVGTFILAAFLLRSAACTINDIVDRDVDAQVGKEIDIAV